MTTRGKAWVCVIDGEIVGFSYIDLKDNNVWALFVHPGFAGQGIGKSLHRIMLDWYCSVTDKTIWLGTDPATKAAVFYRLQGWKEVGMHGSKEIKFEMTSHDWTTKANNRMTDPA